MAIRIAERLLIFFADQQGARSSRWPGSARVDEWFVAVNNVVFRLILALVPVK